MTAPPHVLLVAYQCGPGMGSVSQIGWQWFTGLAERGPVTLVTHARNRPAIEAATNCPQQASIIYIDTEWFAGPLYRLSQRLFPRSQHAVFMMSQADWFVFDAAALRQLRGMRRQGAPWQLLHLVTPVTLSAPTRLHRLGLPVVRGPLNCGLPVPPGFDAFMRQDRMGLSRLRLLPRLVEHGVGSLRHSAAILVATAATRAALPSLVRQRAESMLENAVDTSCFLPAPLPPPPGPQQPLRVCFVGRLVAVKALPLLLQAMARLDQHGRRVELDVVGDGPMALAWKKSAQEIGVAGLVRWHGARTMSGVAQMMRDSHVFCLPSLRESGGAVLLEAMACGRAVIAMDFGGPAEVVDDSIGWKVPMPDEPRAIQGLVDALQQAHDEPESLLRRGEAALTCAHTRHTWPARIEAAQAVYQRVLAQPRDGERRDGFALLSQPATPNDL